MNHLCMHHFSRFTLLLLTCALLWSGLGRVSFAADLTASSAVPTVFFDDSALANGGVPEWAIRAGVSTGFFIFDGLTGVAPFIIDVGAPLYSIKVNSSGNVGLGTSTPAKKLHLVAGNNPTIRLEQTQSFGIPARTWDLVANEASFFISDITANSVPFVIAAGAPFLSLFVAPDGRVGLSAIPQGNLHIGGAANKDIFNGLGPDLNTGPAFNFGYSGASFGAGTGFFNVRGVNSGVNPSLRFATVNVQRMIITNAGRVGIGTLAPAQQLDVSGNIRASGNFIAGGTTLNVPDYVFDPDYKLLSLPQLAAYVEKEKHLPDVPSAQEIKTQGVNMSELQMQLLKKVEELTLYAVEQEKTNKAQERTITAQAATIQNLKHVLVDLTARLVAIEQGKKK